MDEVVVVGAGPVGLMLAAELNAWGVATTVLEMRNSVDTRLRAPSVSARTITALERHRLLDRLVSEMNVYYAGFGGHAEIRGDLRVDGIRMLPIRQQLLEEVLEQHARAVGVDVRRGYRVHRVEAGPDHVDVHATGDDGCDHVRRARYVVGCDGGHSVVRAEAGIAFPGRAPTLTGYQAEVVLADDDGLKEGWQRSPAGVSACERYDDGTARVISIEFDGARADRSAPVTRLEVQRSVRRTSGSVAVLRDARSLTRFTDNERIAETYRAGRVLLAGDAAHVHAPFGGQGLNLGILDAVNVGWKLAATVQGWAPDSLLDTYTVEVRPVAERAQQIVRAAVILLDPRSSAAWELFHELQQLAPVRRHMHEQTAMAHTRYDFGDPDGTVHHLVGTASYDVYLDRGSGPVPLSRVMRAGRGLLLCRPGRQRAAREVAAWRDRIDVAHAAIGTSAPEREIDREVAALLLRPDGVVVWAGGVDEAALTGLREALRRWYGSAVSSRCQEPIMTPNSGGA